MSGIMWAIEKMGAIMRSNPGIAAHESALLAHIADTMRPGTSEAVAFSNDRYGAIATLLDVNSSVNVPKAWNAFRDYVRVNKNDILTNVPDGAKPFVDVALSSTTGNWVQAQTAFADLGEDIFGPDGAPGGLRTSWDMVAGTIMGAIRGVINWGKEGDQARQSAVAGGLTLAGLAAGFMAIKHTGTLLTLAVVSVLGANFALPMVREAVFEP
jgi:hypothetical protein